MEQSINWSKHDITYSQMKRKKQKKEQIEEKKNKKKLQLFYECLGKKIKQNLEITKFANFSHHFNYFNSFNHVFSVQLTYL